MNQMEMTIQCILQLAYLLLQLQQLLQVQRTSLTMTMNQRRRLQELLRRPLTAAVSKPLGVDAEEARIKHITAAEMAVAMEEAREEDANTKLLSFLRIDTAPLGFQAGFFIL